MKIIFFYIRDFFSFVVDLFEFIFELISKLVDILVAGFNFLVSVIGAFPTVFLVSGSALIIISILYKVLGREGQD